MPAPLLCAPAAACVPSTPPLSPSPWQLNIKNLRERERWAAGWLQKAEIQAEQVRPALLLLLLLALGGKACHEWRRLHVVSNSFVLTAYRIETKGYEELQGVKPPPLLMPAAGSGGR